VPVFGSGFAGKDPSLWQYLSAFNFFLLVHQSILVFSWYEMKEKPEEKNFAQKLGEAHVKRVVISITIVVGLPLLLGIEGYMKNVFLIELLMACATLAIFLFPEKLSLNQRYRWIGEIVFWLPGLLIFS